MISYHRSNGFGESRHYYPTQGDAFQSAARVALRGDLAFAHWYAGLINDLNGCLAIPPNLFEYLGM